MSNKKSDNLTAFLTFKSGKFSFVHNFENHKLYTQVAQALILNETIVDLPILPNMASELELEVHYRSIAGTAAIENNPLTESDVKNLAEGRDVKGYSKKHKQEILNLIEAYKILSNSSFNNPLTLSEDFIKSLHKDITQDVEHEYNVPGNYRNNEVYVGDKAHGGIYKPPKILKDVEDLMNQFIAWINSEKILEINPIIRAALAHYHLCLIHPFADGNGRTARLLEAIMLKSSGMSYAFKELSNYYYRNIDDYYIAFSKSIELKKVNDVSPFLEFMLKGTIDSLREIKAKVVEFIRFLALKDYHLFLLNKKDITKRQHSFLSLLLDQRDRPFSFNDLYVKPMFEVLYGNVSKQTARRDLKKLETLGLITKSEDKQYVFNRRHLG